MVIASYAAVLFAGIVIGIAIGQRRDAKARNEIARFGAMVIEAMKEKVGTPI